MWLFLPKLFPQDIPRTSQWAQQYKRTQILCDRTENCSSVSNTGITLFSYMKSKLKSDDEQQLHTEG